MHNFISSQARIQSTFFFSGGVQQYCSITQKYTGQKLRRLLLFTVVSKFRSYGRDDFGTNRFSIILRYV